MSGRRLTSDDKSKIIEMYKSGYSQQNIADSLGCGREAVCRALKNAREQGLITERDTVSGEYRKHFTIASKYDVELIKAYNQGLNYTEIAEITGMSKSGVGKRVRKLILDGRLVPRTETAPKRTRVYKPREKSKKALGYKLNETPVKCTLNVCATCVYGYERPNQTHKCRFALCTGRCRSLLTNPPMTAQKCLVYEKITKTNPRRKDIEDGL